MGDSEQTRELHLLLTDSHRGAVLVDTSGALPRTNVEYSPDERSTASARRAVRDAWGLEVAILEVHCVDSDSDGDPASAAPVLAVLDAADRGWAAPRECRWRPLGDADPEVAPALRPRLTELLAESRGDRETASLRAPWARRGWYRQASDWITQQLIGHGRRPTGPIEQFRHWELSAVMRVDTVEGRVWFKAVFPHFAHEPAVTDLIDRELPGVVARVIAIDPMQGWLLLEDVGAEFVHAHPDLDAATIRRLVECQRTFVGRAADLLAVGCPARPLTGLAADLARALGDPAVREWIDVTDRRAHDVIAWTERAATEVDRLGYPDTLVHGDFHPENAVVTADGPAIFDWSDAAVANPLVDAMTWSGWLRDDVVRGERGWRVFLDEWSDVCPVERVAPNRSHVAGLAAAYHAISYAGIVTQLEPLQRWDLASGLDRYFRMLDRAVPK